MPFFSCCYPRHRDVHPTGDLRIAILDNNYTAAKNVVAKTSQMEKDVILYQITRDQLPSFSRLLLTNGADPFRIIEIGGTERDSAIIRMIQRDDVDLFRFVTGSSPPSLLTLPDLISPLHTQALARLGLGPGLSLHLDLLPSVCYFHALSIAKFLLAQSRSISSPQWYESLFYAACNITATSNFLHFIIQVDTPSKTHKLPSVDKLLSADEPAPYQTCSSITDKNGASILHYLALSQHRDRSIIPNFIQAGCNINAVDMFNNTPLHYATILDQIDNIHLLLSMGADMFSRNTKGASPISLASPTIYTIYMQHSINTYSRIGEKDPVAKTKLVFAQHLDQYPLHSADPSSASSSDRPQ
jgi:hypothetical protein